MLTDQNQKSPGTSPSQAPAADMGNASNPAPDADSLSSAPGEQLLQPEAEKYLREAANIEDVPDARDQQEMDETLEKEANQ